MLSEIEFEKLIKEMNDRNLLEFVARQGWDVNSRVGKLEFTNKQRNTTAGSISAGISAGMTTALYFLIDYFRGK